MTYTSMYQDRITINPDILAGKPVVKGTRVPVEVVLEYLAYDQNIHTLFDAFPRLTIEDVKACLGYAQRAVEKDAPRQSHAHV